MNANLYLSFVWPGKSRLEYCLDNALKSFSPRPLPPRAGSNVGRAAVVIFDYFHFLLSIEIRGLSQTIYNTMKMIKCQCECVTFLFDIQCGR